MSRDEKTKPEVGSDGLDRTLTLHEGHTQARRLSLEDAVFGVITDEGPNYRNVHMIPTSRKLTCA